jgi:putative cardiolipin synthase
VIGGFVAGVLLLAACGDLAIAAASPGLAAAAAAVTSRQGSPDGRTSGLLVLDSGVEALRARDALIAAARESIDAQYYIWNPDSSGRYLAARLLAAADRGVRVRVLLDDMNVVGRDAELARLAGHPNIRIRVYNPGARQGGVVRLFGFAREFGRLNRRMHNKSLTIDGAVTVVGGRNIGDEYFDLHPATNFRDRDVLAVGPVVAGVATGFEGFWTSPWSYPVGTLLGGEPAGGPLLSGEEALAATGPVLAGAGYTPPADLADHVASQILPVLHWAPARLVYDPPPTAAQMADSSTPQPVAQALRALVGQAQGDLLLESAYFILGDESLAEAARLTARGIRVRALTNSLASNDLVTNHSGYARRRQAMLAAGLELHELRPDAAACARLVQASPACAAGPGFALHSKSIVVDRRQLVVGSFNVNLRSTYLNSETVLIIDSPELAAQVAAAIEELLQPDSSWRVTLGAEGLEWTTTVNGVEVRATREPMTSGWRRFTAGFYGLFPLEKYL